MTPEQFCYWLQGFVEIHGRQPTDDEWTVIKDHLQEVFKKETPDRKPKEQLLKDALRHVGNERIC